MVAIPTTAFGGRSISENSGTSVGQTSGQQASQSASQSQSSSFIPNYSETPILDSLAQYAENMAPQVYNWGMQTYGQNQGDINALKRTADTFASGQRLAADVGQAEAGVEMAGEQALKNSKEELASFGIDASDPSSGRYAALDQASRVQNAAAAAGAGNMQRASDIATSNAMNNQAISAELQNSNFGLGVSGAMNNLLATGLTLKYPPLGNQSSSSSESSSAGSNIGSNESENSGFSLGAPQIGSGGGGSGGGGSGGGATSGLGSSNRGGGSGPPSSSSSPYPTSGLGNQTGGSAPSYSVPPAGGGSEFGGDTGGGYTGDPNTFVGPNQYDAPGEGGYATGDESGSGAFFAGGGPVDDDGDGDQDMPGGYDPDQDGPAVGQGMSPSGGMQTDDVPAHLNAGEFVLPNDVVRWKGEEYFQKLISQSREARNAIMQAHGQTQGMNLGGAV